MNPADYDPNSKNVSGPINVVRLEGQINNITKIIYLFMDFHIPLGRQRQCTNIYAHSVQQYFAQNFSQLNDRDKMYDFFLEIFPSDLHREYLNQSYSEMYIIDLRRFFKKLLVFDQEQNKISLSQYFKHVRFHYMDIRNYYIVNFHTKFPALWSVYHSWLDWTNIDPHSLTHMQDELQLMRQKLLFAIELLAHKSDSKQTYHVVKEAANPQAKDEDNFSYFLHKIKHRYHYPVIKKKLTMYLEETQQNLEIAAAEVEALLKKCTEYGKLMAETESHLEYDKKTEEYDYGLAPYVRREMIKNIGNDLEHLQDNIINHFVVLMDVYFLRRFLDKDYITNAIVYTGARHSSNYVRILIQSFGFKVTHVSYSKITDLTVLNMKLKHASWFAIEGLLLPPIFKQCSDMSHFPDNFA